jgi:hypothetical protein
MTTVVAAAELRAKKPMASHKDNRKEQSKAAFPLGVDGGSPVFGIDGLMAVPLDGFGCSSWPGQPSGRPPRIVVSPVQGVFRRAVTPRV